MKNKQVWFIRILRRRAPVTCRTATVPMLGTQIGKQPERAPDDYSFMFQGF